MSGYKGQKRSSGVASAMSEQRMDYDMARETRFQKRLTGVASSGSGADWHYRSESDYLKMMERARAYDRNDPVVGQAITRLIDNVLQDGIQVDPDTGDPEVDTLLAEKWREWGEDPDACHYAQDMTFAEIAECVLRSTIVDGDIFALPLTSGHLQLVEAHRCRTPNRTQKNVIHGILLEPMTRRPIEYWFTSDVIDPMDLVKVSDIQKVPARDKNGNRRVFHVRMAKRPTQTRGVTAFAPIFNLAAMHDDSTFAQLVQQQVVSSYGIIREREIGGDYALTPPATGAVESQTLGDGSSIDVMDLAPGTEITGAPGEKIKAFNSNVPSPESMAFTKNILTYIAINLDLPRHVFLLDPSDTNFSGWRGAIQQAKYGWKRLQRRCVTRFYRPTYRWKVRQWMDSDPRIRDAAGTLGMAIYNHYWCPPYWPYIDPEKDAKADTLIIEKRLNSRRAVAMERGLYIEEIDRDAANDQEQWILMCIERANRVNQQFPYAAVTWRDIDAIVRDPKAAVAAPAKAEEPDPMNDDNEDEP